MKRILCKLAILSTLIPSYPACEQFPLSVSADMMTYQQKMLTMEGSVILNNDIGQLKASKATLYHPADASIESFNDVELEENVLITMRDGGTLSCPYASFDSKQHRATFDRKESFQLPRYRRNTINTKGRMVPLDIECCTMNILLKPSYSPTDTTASTLNLEEITADNKVLIHYDLNILISADHARYDCTVDQHAEMSEMTAGTLRLTPKPERRCRISFGGGHVVEADEIQVDTHLQTFYLEKPTGDLLAIYENGQIERLEFSSEIMYWEHENQLLVLNGDVKLYGRGLGTFTTDKETRIHLDMKEDGEQRIKTIESFGKTTLTYDDVSNGETRKLTCYERAFIDHRNLIATLESPAQNGDVPADLRLYYEDRAGSLSANHATLRYKIVDELPALSTMVISGNVEMENTASMDPQDTKPVHQIAIADRVEVFADENKVHLFADEGKRVLYYDLLNQIQISAPGIVASRDGKKGKEYVKGLGTVRCSFLDSELDALYQRFSFKQHNIASEKEKKNSSHQISSFPDIIDDNEETL